MTIQQTSRAYKTSRFFSSRTSPRPLSDRRPLSLLSFSAARVFVALLAGAFLFACAPRQREAAPPAEPSPAFSLTPPSTPTPASTPTPTPVPVRLGELPVKEIQYSSIDSFARSARFALQGDLFRFFSDELDHLDNDLKREAFLVSPDAAKFQARLTAARDELLQHEYVLAIGRFGSGKWKDLLPSTRTSGFAHDFTRPRARLDPCWVGRSVAKAHLISGADMGGPEDDGIWVPQLPLRVSTELLAWRFLDIPCSKAAALSVLSLEEKVGSEPVEVFVHVRLAPTLFEYVEEDCFSNTTATRFFLQASAARVILRAKDSKEELTLAP